MSIFDPRITTHYENAFEITSCLPGLGGQSLWRASSWGAVASRRISKAWEDAEMCESVDVAEMRAWCWHRGAGEIHGALFDLQSLDMLLVWFAVDALEMRFAPAQGGGLLFSDGERIAHVPATTWSVPEKMPCRACQHMPEVRTRRTVQDRRPEPQISLKCQCGVASPWRTTMPDALAAWNEFCGEPLKHPPIWKWSARKQLAEHLPTFGPPVPLVWFDDEDRGPATVPLVLEGMSLSDKYPPTVRLRLPGTILDGCGGMDIPTLRALHAMVSSALEWAEGREGDR